MILPISNIKNHNNMKFTSNDVGNNGEKKLKYDKDTLLDNDFWARVSAPFDKFGNALTLYPAKGITGNKNANFYEFLTMGIIPYLTGSVVMMSVFNSKNKVFAPFAASKAGAIGRKMALGVLFYGLMKEIAKPLVTTPVKWLTGVDTEVPYAKVNYELPDHINDTDIMSIEHHKVFESKEFPRWDLLYKSESEGHVRNEYFDNVAKKLGFGENLPDSDQEMKPVIKDIAVKTDLAKTISSYMWAATGVMLASQEPWDDYFKVATLKFWKPKDFVHSMKVFGRSFKKSAVEFFNGPKLAKGFEKHAGKVMIGLAALSTVAGVLNAVNVKKPPKANGRNIDKNGKCVVD